MSSSPSADARLGARLVAAGLLTQQHLDETLRAQRQLRGSLGYHLLRLGKMEAATLSAFLDDEIAGGRLPAPRAAGEDVLDALSARLAQLYNAYPISHDGHRLLVALPPLHGDAVNAIAEATGLVIEPVILPAKRLREAVERDYLGAAREAVQHPAAGLTRFVVDDGESVKPVAPGLRSDTLSPEVWLRSVLAEAIAQRRRHLDLSVNEPLPAARERAQAVIELVEGLARLPPRGPGRVRGRFQLDLRGRRPVADVVRDGWQEPRLSLHLAEQRFTSEDPDDLFAGHAEAMDAVEALVTDGKGLLLIVGAAGGGARRLVHVLAERLAELLPGGAWTGDGTPAGFDDSHDAADDEEVARGLHASLAAERPLVVAEELRGPRSFERALLVAARAPVLAGFVAADAVAALAWLQRQGLGGALKVGLLRGVVALLGTDEACASCATDMVLPPALARRWGVDEGARGRANAGCATCLEPAVRRTIPHIAWTAVAGQPEAEFLIEEEERSRQERAAGGRPSLLATIVERPDADLSSAAMLLQAAP